MPLVRVVLLVIASLFLVSTSAVAQFPVVNAKEVYSWVNGKRQVVVIDTRLPEEYKDGHIPGALNIPAERMKVDAARLPADKATPLIFYCRGAG